MPTRARSAEAGDRVGQGLGMGRCVSRVAGVAWVRHSDIGRHWRQNLGNQLSSISDVHWCGTLLWGSGCGVHYAAVLARGALGMGTVKLWPWSGAGLATSCISGSRLMKGKWKPGHIVSACRVAVAQSNLASVDPGGRPEGSRCQW